MNDGVNSGEVTKFFQKVINRTRINLSDAQKRNDTKAVANIQRKLEIYEWTVDFIDTYTEIGR